MRERKSEMVFISEIERRDKKKEEREIYDALRYTIVCDYGNTGKYVR